MTRTSISDLEWYRNECELAVNDPTAFSRFRQNPVLNQIWEHVTYAQGEEYLKHIDLDRFHPSRYTKNDTIGGADTHYYPSIDLAISPSTLRYVHVLSELSKHFDLSKIKSVAEIGVGYGGQAAVLLEHLGWETQYKIIDLPEVRWLADKYLGELGSSLGYRTIDMRAEFDLLISNYAFSELTADKQQEYYDTIVVRSKNIYMVYNHISDAFGIQSWSVADLGRKLMSDGYTVQIFDEIPSTHPKNRVIVATK